MVQNILIGYLTEGVHSGIDQYLLNFVEIAFENGVHVDFLTNQVTPDLQQELAAKFGSKLLEIPSLKHPVAQYRRIRKILTEEKYDCTYFNISEAFHCIGAFVAKREKVPRRMIHSHSSGVSVANPVVRRLRRLLHYMVRPFLVRCGTHFFACSDLAGQWLFPRKTRFSVIYNAINSDRFVYRPAARESLRRELGIGEETLVLGHVGHFTYQKNNFFLIDIFSEVKKLCPESMLLSVGCGEDFDRVVSYAKHLGLNSDILFLGVRKDIPELMAAMDCFVLPSRFEGLGIVGIEAQFCGLPVVFSAEIPREAALSDRAVFLKKGVTARQWAMTILQMRAKRCAAHLPPTAFHCYSLAEQHKQTESLLLGKD